jgi:hypothetical protein
MFSITNGHYGQCHINLGPKFRKKVRLGWRGKLVKKAETMHECHTKNSDITLWKREKD